MLKKVKRFVIDRGWWFNGDVIDQAFNFNKDREDKSLQSVRFNDGSCLLREEDGTMCCLGVYGRACGIPKEDLVGVGLPGDLMKKEEHGSLYEGLPVNYMATTNDDGSLTDKEREKRLVAAFADAGIKVTFKGKSKTAMVRVINSAAGKRVAR